MVCAAPFGSPKMPRLIIASLLALSVLFAPLTIAAQSSAPSGGQLFDQEHRQQIYDARKLSYGEAAAWSLLPGFGNFYADQYLLGALAVISTVFAGFFVAYGVINEQSDLLWTGVGLGGVTYLWSTGTALWGVSAYNEELRQNLHLDKAPASKGVSLVVRF